MATIEQRVARLEKKNRAIMKALKLISNDSSWFGVKMKLKKHINDEGLTEEEANE